jgi:integrase
LQDENPAIPPYKPRHIIGKEALNARTSGAPEIPGAKTLTIFRSLEETKTYGAQFKEPKTARGRRTIAIDDGLTALLTAERGQYHRIVAGVEDGTAVDLSLVKLPADALMFPTPGDDLARPRNCRTVTHEFQRVAGKLGFAGLRLHDLRGTHETLLLDTGVAVHVVAARCGHDPAVLLRSYARRTKKADTSAAAVIGALSQGMLGAT